MKTIFSLFQKPDKEISHLLALYKQCRKEKIHILKIELCSESSLIWKEEGLLCLTDSQKILDLAKNKSVACVGYEWKERLNTDYIVQDFEGVSASWLSMVYNRFHDIPLIIAETKRLRIREIAKRDIPVLYALWQEKDVRPHVREASLEKEEVEAFLEAYRKQRYLYASYGMWVIEERQTGEFLGEIGLEDGFYPKKGEIVEIGYAIRKEKRKRGYATEAIRAVLSYAEQLYKRGELWADSLYCFVQSENVISQKTAQSAGFSLLDAACKFDEFDGLVNVFRIDHDRGERGLPI